MISGFIFKSFFMWHTATRIKIQLNGSIEMYLDNYWKLTKKLLNNHALFVSLVKNISRSKQKLTDNGFGIYLESRAPQKALPPPHSFHVTNHWVPRLILIKHWNFHYKQSLNFFIFIKITLRFFKSCFYLFEIWKMF